MDLATKKEDLAIFKEWLKKQPYLPQHMSDAFIGHFLHASKGSLERAKRSFDKYFKNLQISYGSLTDLDPCSEAARKFDKNCVVCLLPETTPEGHIILVSKLMNATEPSSAEEYLVRQSNVAFMMLLSSDVPYKGMEFILDMEGVNMAHLSTLTPSLIQRIVENVQQVVPIPVKGMHIVNPNPWVEKIYKFFSTLISEKMKGRMKIHSGVESLREVFPPKILPKEFGGDGDDLMKIAAAYYEENYVKKRDQIIEERKLRQNELELRPKDEIRDEMAGTFKQLQID